MLTPLMKGEVKIKGGSLQDFSNQMGIGVVVGGPRTLRNTTQK